MTVKLLAIETATEACSAALYIDGEVIEQYQLAPRKHNELILPMCEQLLSEADIQVNQIDAVAFGCGPGAFTGLRIAASVAQAIAIAHELPVACVSTLANLANQVDLNSGECVMPAIDARMQEVYWAIYEKDCSGNLLLVGEEKVQAPHMIENVTNIQYGCGTGWASYRDELNASYGLNQQSINEKALPRASITAAIGVNKYYADEMVDAVDALPVYLRNQVIHQK